MKITSTVIAAALSAAMASPAIAGYTGLTVELHTTVTVAAQARSVFRIYANFSDPGDRLVAVVGSPTFGTMTIQSRNADDTGFGSNFLNNGGMFAPSAADIAAVPALEWDTFATLGLSISDQSPFGNMISGTPGFTGIIGNNYSTNNGGWFTVPTFDHDSNPGTPQIPPPQTLAGWTGDGDLQNRVMIMQLTVNAGDQVRGTVNLAIHPPIIVGGPGTIEEQQPFQVFNSSAIPAPPALALLALAAISGARARRRC